MTALAELLSAEFVDGEVLQFTGRGNKVFDYIEDETVMDRLDEVLGVGSWSIAVEPIGVSDGIVKVTLSGVTPDGKAFSFEDFGYQTREGGEGLKEAVSDGIRRCGRYLGIGRYLYRKHVAAPAVSRPAAVPQATAATPNPPRPAAVRNPYADPYPAEITTLPAARNVAECPVHHKPWKTNSRGSYCSSKLDDGSWCKEQP